MMRTETAFCGLTITTMRKLTVERPLYSTCRTKQKIKNQTKKLRSRTPDLASSFLVYCPRMYIIHSSIAEQETYSVVLYIHDVEMVYSGVYCTVRVVVYKKGKEEHRNDVSKLKKLYGYFNE
jgi:hypothetical protein